MAKMDEFPMYFGGVEIRGIDELRENFSADYVLEKYHNHNEVLLRWLEACSLKEELKKVQSIRSKNARDVLSELCRIFAVEDISEEIDKDISVKDYLLDLKCKEGWNYYNGNSGEPDYKKATDCFLDAAEQGHSGALNMLVLMYNMNIPCGEQNARRRFNLFFELAKQEHPLAQMMVSSMLYWERDYETASSWLQEYQNQWPSIDQYYRLGVTFFNDKEYTQSFTCFLEAAEKGHLIAQYMVGYIYYYGSEERAKNDTQAFIWFTCAAERGIADAQNMLGRMYYGCDGHDTTRDINKAAMWFDKAAEQGHPDAYRMLLDMMCKCKGYEKVEELRFKLLMRQQASSLYLPNQQSKKNEL